MVCVWKMQVGELGGSRGTSSRLLARKLLIGECRRGVAMDAGFVAVLATARRARE